MLKKILIGAGLTLCVAACATSPSTPGTAPRAAAAKVPPAGCVAETATRSPVSPSECAGAGRVWTDQDVKSTGATDVAQALRQLDPTVVISH
jgi:hypothetical protein